MCDAAATSKLRRMTVKSEMIDHRKVKSMPKIVIYGIYDTTWNLKPVSKEEFQSSAFLGQSVRRFFEIFVLDSSEKSCQIESFPSNQ